MADQEPKQAAVYVAWVTFKNAIERLATQGLPNQIDKSVFNGLAWSVQAHMLTSFKFLGLIHEDGKPTEALKGLAVPDEADRKRALEKILRERYSALFDLDLTKATPDQVNAVIGEAYGAGGATKVKAVRFFLAAAEYVGAPVSPLLMKSKPKVGASGGVASARRRRTKNKAATEENPPPPPPPPQGPAASLSRSIDFGDGVTLTLVATGNVFSAASPDRKFILDLVDMMERHEKRGDEGATQGE